MAKSYSELRKLIDEDYKNALMRPLLKGQSKSILWRGIVNKYRTLHHPELSEKQFLSIIARCKKQHGNKESTHPIQKSKKKRITFLNTIKALPDIFTDTLLQEQIRNFDLNPDSY
jgi:hypothetical protein